MQYFVEKLGKTSGGRMFFLIKKETIMAYHHISDIKRYYIEWQYGKLSFRKTIRALGRDAQYPLVEKLSVVLVLDLIHIFLIIKRNQDKLSKKSIRLQQGGACKLKGKLLKTSFF